LTLPHSSDICFVQALSYLQQYDGKQAYCKLLRN